MRIYYTNRLVLGGMCLFNELFYAALYLLHFTPGPLIFGISTFKMLAIVSAPVAIVKTGITVIHGFVASCNMGTIDVNERAAMKETEAAKKPE